MNAYIITLSMCNIVTGTYAVSLIVRSTTNDERKLAESAIARLNKPADIVLDYGIEVIEDSVLVALATIAQEKGLI